MNEINSVTNFLKRSVFIDTFFKVYIQCMRDNRGKLLDQKNTTCYFFFFYEPNTGLHTSGGRSL